MYERKLGTFNSIIMVFNVRGNHFLYWLVTFFFTLLLAIRITLDSIS
jgi:hypothetical protein